MEHSSYLFSSGKSEERWPVVSQIYYILPTEKSDRYAQVAMRLILAMRQTAYPHVIVDRRTIKEALREPPSILVFFSKEDADDTEYRELQWAGVQIRIIPEHLQNDLRDIRAYVLS